MIHRNWLVAAALAAAGFCLFIPQKGRADETKTVSEVSPGTITNIVHPGDPVQEITVVGFGSMKDAIQFAGGNFLIGNLDTRFHVTLKREESVRFEGAEYLVFYYFDKGRKPVLLSITRCHADLHLVFGSCGFQFLLNVKTE